MEQFIHQTLLRILPSWIHNRLIGAWSKDGLKKYFKNTGWIFLAKMVTFAVSFFTIALVARYLGPENYGKLSYAQSFVAIFSVFASLGFDQILYRDLIAHPEKQREILGTAFVAKLTFGFLTLIAASTSAWILNDDPILTWLIFIVALTFILQPFSVVGHYFNAQVQAKYTSYISIGIAFLIPTLKLLIIWLSKGIIYFALLTTLEALILAIGYIYIYVHIFKENPLNWRYSVSVFKKLINDSWPLLLAGLSGYIYGRIDQVMIQHLMNSTSVGLYDAAVRLTEIWGFFPGVFIISLFPAIVNARTSNHSEYIKRFRILSFFTLGLASLIAVMVFIIAPLIIKILFGAEFATSAIVLRIYIWSLVGAIASSLIQGYLIAENESRKILALTAFGAILNIMLNTQLIPQFGIYGAAYATLISYSAIIAAFLITEKRLFLNLRKNGA